MEVLTNAANAASKAIFGSRETETQSTTEPQSGQIGSGTVSDPYDAGNLRGPAAPSQFGSENVLGRDREGPVPGNEGPHQTSIANKLDPYVDSDGDGKPRTGPTDFQSADNTQSTVSATKPNESLSTTAEPNYAMEKGSSDEHQSGTAGESASFPNSSGISSSSADINTPATNQATGGPVRPEHDTDKTGVTDFHSTDASTSSKPLSSANASSIESNGQGGGPVGGTGAVEPSVGVKPSFGAAPFQKQQGADRPTAKPSGEEVDAIRKKKDEAEGALAGNDPVCTKEGGVKKDPNDHSGEPLGKVDHGAGSNTKENNAEPGGSSKEKGTGEEWVKTSGVAAEGGDFDATKPGAGKEADRLLEQKGIHKNDSGAQERDGDAPDPHDSVKKPSIGQKLKEKLHIGKSKPT